MNALIELGIFAAKTFIIVLFLFLLIAGILSLFSKGKDTKKGRLVIKNLKKQLLETTEALQHEILPKSKFKHFQKDQKKLTEKQKKQDIEKNIFVIDFNGDIKASAVPALREEITAIINIAKPTDEVVLRLESPGGMVHAYGLGAAQLQRLRDCKIPLTVIVDKVAASGGYLMACVANKIISAPFAIIGSIGVIFQLPNFHRLLQEKKIDFEQITAGSFKRTLTLFGPNTEAARDKLQQELEAIHSQFKYVIKEHRPQLDVDKISTGEHWLGKEALAMNLVDELKTSDDYLLSQCKNANVFEISYRTKKSLSEKIMHTAHLFKHNILASTGYYL